MHYWINYLFELTPGSPNRIFWIGLIIAAAIMILAGIVGIIWQRKEDKFSHHLGERLTLWGFTAAVVTLLLASFRLQNIFWFAMRFLIYFWAVLTLVWVLIIARWWFLIVPKLRARRENNQKYNKYLPGRK